MLRKILVRLTILCLLLLGAGVCLPYQFRSGLCPELFRGGDVLGFVQLLMASICPDIVAPQEGKEPKIMVKR